MMTDNNVWSWWGFLCAVAGLNIVAWLISAWWIRGEGGGGDGLRGHEAVHEAAHDAASWITLRRWQLCLSAGYVFGCAYRSFMPVYDVPRLCLFDTAMCSVIVGRSVATVAELCFVAQWALLLREASRVAGSALAGRIARVLLPLIAVAELCSWYSVLSTSNLGHVMEESLWGLCAGLLVVSLMILWPRVSVRYRPWLTLWSLAGVAYVGYMFLVDVPMYWSRWLADEAQGRAYLSLGQGLMDASARWVVSHRWSDWQSEVTWMSLYFSVAVWLSIALVHVPRLERRAATVSA